MWRRVDNHDLDCDSYHFDGDGELDHHDLGGDGDHVNRGTWQSD